MKALELLGEIDGQHWLRAQVPEGFPAGSVRVIVLMPEEDQAGFAWAWRYLLRMGGRIERSQTGHL